MKTIFRSGQVLHSPLPAVTAPDGVLSEFPAGRDAVVTALNQTLSIETASVLRYRRYHFMARGIKALGIADEFLVLAHEKQAHADQIAERIVQMGGVPQFAGPGGPPAQSDGTLISMMQELLIAERIAISCYREIAEYLEVLDAASRAMLKQILAAKEEHAGELAELVEEHQSRSAAIRN